MPPAPGHTGDLSHGGLQARPTLQGRPGAAAGWVSCSTDDYFPKHTVKHLKPQPVCRTLCVAASVPGILGQTT